MDKTNKKFWDRIARFYALFQEKGNRDLYVALCDKIRPFLSKEQVVLELACGTGQLTAMLARDVLSWMATDFSAKMVHETRKRIGESNVTCEVQDASSLSYEDNSFELVIIANALHVMPDPVKALQEIGRVLKPDGTLIAATFVYEGKINRVGLRILESLGFKTFNKWSSADYKKTIVSNGFVIKSEALIQGKLLPECLLRCEKNMHSCTLPIGSRSLPFSSLY